MLDDSTFICQLPSSAYRDGVASARCRTRDLNSRDLSRVGSLRWLNMIELLGGKQSSNATAKYAKSAYFRFPQQRSIGTARLLTKTAISLVLTINLRTSDWADQPCVPPDVLGVKGWP
jgi:hypothetical protein